MSALIYIIGAGSIVINAHLPAYKIAGYKVAGIYDLDVEKATETGSNFAIPVFNSINEIVAAATNNAVFDIAVPASQIIAILNKLPNNAFVLLQKPMGENYQQAIQILELCKIKNITAAVNFQLRYAPFILQAKKLLPQLGAIYNIEINVNVYTPWHLWNFLFMAPRVEILYHSIHYIDLIRNLLGNPKTVYAKTTKNASMPQLASVCSNIIMDYGDFISANIRTNHCHNYSDEKQDAYIKIECEKGAIKINFGALINYPTGKNDTFAYIILEDSNNPTWKEMKIDGSWFPHAFIGSMEQVILTANKKIEKPDNSVEDCINTMACVEAAYKSSEQGGVSLNDI
jgi:predicted dehydrogenase